ncbi:MAG: hypothetical protein JWN54_1796, partial [Mycobacterium sp.]|nr:hypothetical protein [Mycobacterium sp.]
FGLDSAEREAFIAGPQTTAAPAAAAVVPAQLPRDVAAFAGRRDDLVRLWSLLETGAFPVISGTAGVGKTTLAVHWAHQIADRFPDGQLYVNLHGFGPGDAAIAPEDVLADFLAALGTPADAVPGAAASRITAYRSRLAGKRVLVVLDNARDAEQVRPLLPGAPDCAVVVTSRSSLVGLTVSHGARVVRVDSLPEAEAVALLGEVVGRGRVAAEPAAAARVAWWCGHLPLALRIAAERISRAPDATLADLAGELADTRHRLDLLATDDEATTVRAVFSWSHRALGDDAARAFGLLGLHAGPDLGTPAAAALLGARTEVARHLLETLAGVHLLERSGRDRYRFHDLLRLYALERVTGEPPEDRARAVDRMLGWYVHSAHAADRALGPPARHRLPLGACPAHCGPMSFAASEQAMAWCEAERANLVAAVHQAARADPPHAAAWQLPNVLWWYFYLRKHSADWITATRRGLAAARRLGDTDAESRCWNVLGSAYGDLRRLDDALDCYRRALDLRVERDDPACRGIILHNLGITSLEAEHFDDALVRLRQALDLRRAIGDRYGEGCTLSALGDAHRQLDQLAAAALCLHRALRIRREAGNTYGQASTLHNLGDTYLAAGRYDTAFGYLHRALELCAELENPHGTATVLFSLGRGQCLAGQPDRARHSLVRALALFTELGAPQAADVRAHLERLAGHRPAQGPVRSG